MAIAISELYDEVKSIRRDNKSLLSEARMERKWNDYAAKEILNLIRSKIEIENRESELRKTLNFWIERANK
jgi:hypothetical protein